MGHGGRWNLQAWWMTQASSAVHVHAVVHDVTRGGARARGAPTGCLSLVTRESSLWSPSLENNQPLSGRIPGGSKLLRHPGHIWPVAGGWPVGGDTPPVFPCSITTSILTGFSLLLFLQLSLFYLVSELLLLLLLTAR